MDANGNDGCMEGYMCPRCGNSEYLKVSAVLLLELTDTGTADEGGDHVWPEGDVDYMSCPECSFDGPARFFEIGDGAAHAPPKRAVWDLMNRPGPFTRGEYETAKWKDEEYLKGVNDG